MDRVEAGAGEDLGDARGEPAVGDLTETFADARPFVPRAWALMSFLHPGCCRQFATSRVPSAYSYTTEKWS